MQLSADLPLKSHERVFFDRACRCPSSARSEIELTDPWDFAVLAEAVEAWGFRASQSRGDSLRRKETALLWLETEYRPVDRPVARARPDRRPDGDTEAYMRIAAGERYRLLRTRDWSEEVLRHVVDGKGVGATPKAEPPRAGEVFR